MDSHEAMAGRVDVLSPLARTVLGIDVARAYTRLVVSGPGNPAGKAALAGVKPEELLTRFPASRDDNRAMLAGLWLWHDWLDESHTISQGIHTPTGSFWHAIMHRREGDFSNSKYWYHKCDGHETWATLASQAPAILRDAPADNALLRVVARGWNPDALVDLVESVHESPDHPNHRPAISLQQLEWRVLFDHCVRQTEG